MFSIGFITPSLKAVQEGKVAGKAVFDIIDRVPNIQQNDPKAKVLDKISGNIEFKDVDFFYPTRPDAQVLTKFSHVFEAGKTTAIVGPSGSGKSTVVQLMERFYDPNGG